MHVYELLDVGTIEISAALARNAKFFTRSLDLRPLVEVAAESEASVDTPVGAFEAAYLPWQWRGPDYPTIIYHHGSGERPFDFGWFRSNSFRRLFVAADEAIPANLVAVRAPFHDGSNMDYARAMGDLENLVGMLAASVGLIDALATRANERTSSPILASGISFGGWAVNLHRACFDTVDRYVPIFAGAALGETFVSSVYQKMTAEPARRRPVHLCEVLDFEEESTAVGADDCFPLLARYDHIIEYDRQRPAYERMPLSVLDEGHVTGSLATDPLRKHVLCVLSASNADGTGRE